MREEDEYLAPRSEAMLVETSAVEQLLAQVRPAWQGKRLIERVTRVLPADPSSACQRLFNAAIQDLREKIIMAGLDIAEEMAGLHGLPPVKKNEDILDGYSTTNILDLAYRMGLLTRPGWRRLHRAYDIRRDLEHEDNEYEATFEDCVYMFKTCIEIVLAQEPVELPRVQDIQDLIEVPEAAAPSPETIRDFARAPDPRQKAIATYLVNVALNPEKPDLTRQNAVEALRAVAPHIRNTVKMELAKLLNERGKRKPFDLAQMKVAAAGGFTPYLKQSQVAAFFREFHQRLEQLGHGWRNHPLHGDVLDDLEDVGGLGACPPEPRREVVRWLTLCYLGERGGYGWYGRHRDVFYSNPAAPKIERLFKAAGQKVRGDLEAAGAEDERVKAAVSYQPVARRYERLLDMTEVKG